MIIKIFTFVVIIAAINAIPISSHKENKTEIETLVKEGLVGFVPVVLPLEDIEKFSKTQENESVHNVQKRSLRGDNPSNDLLADFEGANYENPLTGLERRIKTLPTWVG
ncbi:unnamed protein product [Euphydryas editha]|uniref:Uncharacterized protein n=1 Tax=Euphydryas editha TaxID=104508 RepID=A0AAU9TRM9_EUPED|nr:unnamed protein product [Euphydryas editha]CAH2089564.1 unnamed protein product [Euphydryas editha]